MSEILPRIEVYPFGPRDWRYRLVDVSGVTEGAPIRGVSGHAGVASRAAAAAYPDVPIVVLPEPEY